LLSVFMSQTEYSGIQRADKIQYNILRFLPPLITGCVTMLDMQTKNYLDVANAQSVILLFFSIYFLLLGLL